MKPKCGSIANLPVSGLLIVSAAITTVWAENVMRLGLENVWVTWLSAMGLVTIMTTATSALLGSVMRGGLLTALISFYVFYTPPITKLIGLGYLSAIAFHIALILILGMVFRRIPKADVALRRMTAQTNLICLVVFLFSALPFAWKVVGLEKVRGRAQSAVKQLDGEATLQSPDVWHIIFDRYASKQTLRDQYHFDNTIFLESLRDRGFEVSENAFSNYQRTGHSVSSTLNASYLDPVAEKMQGQPSDWVPIYRLMRDSAAIRAFDRMGYQTIFAGSWWEPTRTSNVADNVIAVRSLPQIARTLISSSSIGFWLRPYSIPWLSDRSDQCFRVSEKFRLLKKIANENKRKYVFAHFLVPHPPFVVGSDGNCRSLSVSLDQSRNKNYLEQVKFVNANALRLIDSIIKGPRPSVIILHSDEGPWPRPYVGNEHFLGTDPVPVPWTKLTDGQLHEKFGIILAMRTPKGTPPTTMPNSPVQIYPSILRDHFKSDQVIPETKHRVFVSDEELYEFEDVGPRLHSAP